MRFAKYEDMPNTDLCAPLLGFDATFALENYRGMGKFVRQLVSAYPGPSIAFAPDSACSSDVLPWPLIAEGSGSEPYWEQFHLPRLAARYNVDLLLCGFNTSPIILNCPPTVLVLHDLVFRKPLFPLLQFQSRRQLAGAVYRRLVAPRAVLRAAAILTVSETSRLEICTAYDLPLERVSVVPNTLPEYWFQSNTKPSPRLFDERPYVLAVSGSAPSKNLPRLLQAFANAQKSDVFKGVNLLVVGLGQKEKIRFKNLATAFGIGNRVVLCPRVSDEELRALYRNASLFVFPSIDEGFGIPLLEAMAVGTPVICSSIPVFHEIGLRHVSYFDPFSIHDIEKYLIAGLSCRPDCTALKNATHHARTYSFNIQKKQITGLFKNIIMMHVS